MTFLCRSKPESYVVISKSKFHAWRKAMHDIPTLIQTINQNILDIKIKCKANKYKGKFAILQSIEIISNSRYCTVQQGSPLNWRMPLKLPPIKKNLTNIFAKVKLVHRIVLALPKPNIALETTKYVITKFQILISKSHLTGIFVYMPAYLSDHIQKAMVICFFM